MNKKNSVKNVVDVLKELETRSRLQCQATYKNEGDSARFWATLHEANAFQTAYRLLTDSEYFKDFVHALYD